MTGGSEAAAASLAINLISAVEELNGLTPQELNKLLRESESSTLRYITSTGFLIQIDMERLASSLPLHLIAVLSSAGENDVFSYFGEVGLPLTYFLRGLRLLHSLADLASRHTRFEQIVLEEVRVSEQILDLVFYSLLVLAHYKQEIGSRVSLSLLHSGLVACSLYLLNCCISSNWQDLVLVLLAHPKVDVFMDVAFDAIHIDIKFLDSILSTLNVDVLNEKLSLSAAEKTAICVCQHCEASLQFVLSLCQQKLFRDRVLKNKELCRNGGILSLAQTILDLNIQQCFEESLEMIAGLSRLKSKVLSILLQLCEAESISYLDEVAGYPKSMNLAKSVVLKILDLLKVALGKEFQQLSVPFDRRKPKGLVLLNSMRLADIFSDDSNFRSFFMANITTVLAEILGMPNEKFLSNWCSNDAPVVEEDAILHYDPYTASGTVLVNLSIGPEAALPVSTQKENMEMASPATLTNIPLVSYAQQRTSYLVKVIANLHCFVPNICEEQEKDLFLNKFFEFLCIDKVKLSSCTTAPEIQKASSICANLCSLTAYARSLIPSFLIDDDVGLLSLFYSQLCELIPLQHFMENPTQDVTPHEPTYNLDDDTKINGVPQTSIYPQEHKFHPDEKHKEADDGINNLPQKEEHTEGCIGLVDVKTRGNMSSMEESSQTVENSKEADALKISQEPETVACEEKQPRKRKRNIMNDKQITLIENALLDEPEMQRHAALLQSWAEKLSLHGSELTSSQLKNWLNNRKARLARAAREVRAPSEGETAYDKSVASSISHYYDSPESGGEDSYAPITNRGNSRLNPCVISNNRVGDLSDQPHQYFFLQLGRQMKAILTRCG